MNFTAVIIALSFILKIGNFRKNFFVEIKDINIFTLVSGSDRIRCTEPSPNQSHLDLPSRTLLPEAIHHTQWFPLTGIFSLLTKEFNILAFILFRKVARLSKFLPRVFAFFNIEYSFHFCKAFFHFGLIGGN